MLKTMKRWLLFLWVLCASVSAADIGQAPLLFREDWTSSPPAIPLTQRDISNSQLKLDVHGPGALLIKKSFHDARDWDPHYVWSGLAQGSWAVSLSLADDGIMDLTGTATLRWRSHQSGFHELRAIVELENGDWLVSETSDSTSSQWHIFELVLSDTRWRQLNIFTVKEGSFVSEVSLDRVRSVGFTDLRTGGRSSACSRLDWIEVYGQRIASGPLQLFILSGQSNMVGWGSSLDLESVARFGHNQRLYMFENDQWQSLKPFKDPSQMQRDRFGINEYTFGPEIGFAHELAKAWPGNRIGIVKQAVGGTGIMAWAPAWNQQDADLTSDAHKGPLYQELLNKVKAAIKEEEVEIRGFLWLQGGKDMILMKTADRYAENLETLVNALRHDLGKPELPVLVGTYRQKSMPDDLKDMNPNDFRYESDKPRPGALKVMQAQTNVANTILNSAPVILRELPTYPKNVHANAEGMLLTGQKYASIYLELFKPAE